MSDTRFGQALTRGFTIAIVLALVVAGGIWWTLKDAGRNHLTAYFAGAVGLYEGNSVRMLGVDMGTVTKITPMGNQVKVDFEYDRSVAVPADAKALIVAPSLVSDRYVQLAPAYTGGPRISDGAVIALDRTEVPLEVDQLAASLARVSETLGPNGANKDGALSGVLDTAANTLQGNGASLNSTVGRLADLAKTLDGSKDDLFSTVQNLNSFTGALAQSDQQLNEFYGRVADVSQFLAADSSDVGAALQSLGGALGDVQTFVNDNKGALESNVDKLASLSKVLVDQRAALAEVLDIAPTGATNFINSYDAASGTIAVRDNLNELTNPPILTVCRLISSFTPKQLPDALGNICKQLAPVLDGALKLPTIPQVLNSLQNGTLPPLPLPLVDVMEQLSGGAK